MVGDRLANGGKATGSAGIFGTSGAQDSTPVGDLVRRGRRLIFYSTIRFFFVAALTVGTAIVAERFLLQAERNLVRDQAVAEIGDLRAEIERMVSADIQIVRALVAYVGTDPDIDADRFEEIAPYLLEGSSGAVRNIALARDLIISHTYPAAGNEAALGLDYRTNPAQWPMIRQAVLGNEITMSGPLTLVQGGQGVIARFPIFLPGVRPDEDRLWGLASLVIDMPRFISQMGVEDLAANYAIAIYGETAGNPAVEPFYVTAPPPGDEPLTFPVAVPGTDWRIVVTPAAGWPRFADAAPLIGVMAALFLLAFAYLAWRQFDAERSLIRQSLDLERARAEAERAQRAAEAANRTKTLFLANMSHELRTPLNAIIGFSDVIRRQLLGPVGTPKYLEYLKDINDASTHLLSLLSDILDIARVESGRVEMVEDGIDVSVLVRRTLPLVADTARARDQRIDTDIAADLPTLYGDERLLRQVLINLLNNAIKHTPAGSRIVLRGHLRRPTEPDATTSTGRAEAALPPSGLVLSVEDTGPGLPADVGERVLEPFVRGSETLYSGTEGAGLGLSISVRIMHLHGGRLSIDEAYRAGTKIDLFLPASRLIPRPS